MFRNNLSICISTDNKDLSVSIILNRLCNASFTNSSATTSSPSIFPSYKGTLGLRPLNPTMVPTPETNQS